MDAAIEYDGLHTVDEINELPEGQRAEIIDGVWYDMATTTTTHQLIVSTIQAEFRNHIRANNGKCVTLVSPFAVFINDEDIHNYVEPDVSVVCDPDKLDEKGCHGAPDLVVEVVSPSSRRLDYIIKLNKYLEAGVKEYWIVDPLTRKTHIYYFAGEDEGFELKEAGFDEDISSYLYPGFTINISNEASV